MKTIINKNQQKSLITRIKFMINFIVCTKRDITDIWDILVFESFESSDNDDYILRPKDNQNQYNDYQLQITVMDPKYVKIRYSVITGNDVYDLRFNVTEIEDKEFINICKVISEQVREYEKQRQFELFNNSINDLLNF